MSQLSPILRKAQGGYLHWCPGCAHAHYIAVERETGPRWSFNGDAEKPTFAPSVRIFTPAQAETRDPDGTVWEASPERTNCHYFVREGRIEFCADSAHTLAGQTVPLPAMPSADEYGYSD